MSKWILFCVIWLAIGSVLLFPYFVNNAPCPFSADAGCRPTTSFVDMPPLPVVFFPTYAVLHIATNEFAIGLTPGVHWYQGLALFLPVLWMLYAFLAFALFRLYHSWNRGTWMDLLVRAIAYSVIVAVVFIVIKIFVMKGSL